MVQFDIMGGVVNRWRQSVVAAAVCACLLASAGGVRADADEYDQLESHPLRLVAYIIHPVGYALEWLVARPLHYLVSRPSLEEVFGHHRHHADEH